MCNATMSEELTNLCKRGYLEKIFKGSVVEGLVWNVVKGALCVESIPRFLNPRGKI